MVALLMGAALILAVCVPLPWLLTHEHACGHTMALRACTWAYHGLGSIQELFLK